MFALAKIVLPEPVTIRLPGSRGICRTFKGFDLCFAFLPAFRTIYAQLAGIPQRLPIYGPDDWPFVLADIPDQHAERVLQILGSDPASVLQALCDGRDIPAPPPRVPREIANWRAKAVLSGLGLLDSASAALDALPEPARTVARLAWTGDAKLSRSSPAVAFIAASIGLSESQLDRLFIDGEALVV